MGANRQKPRHLLSGLLRCGVCGGGLSSGNANTRRRLYCTNWKESRSCDSSRHFYADEIERRVLNGLRKHLSNPTAIAHFLKTYTAERKRLAEGGAATRADLERRLARADGELQRLVQAMSRSTAPVETFTAEIDRLSAENKEIEAKLAALSEPVNVISLHPAAVSRYLKKVSELATGLKASDDNEQTRAAIRDLLLNVTVTPAPAGELPAISVQGKLEALIGLPCAVVAGTGVEPATYGL